jgi:hypothetical protein
VTTPDGDRPTESTPAVTDAAPGVAPPDALVAPSTMAPTPEIAPTEGDSVLPGGHRGGFQRLPTAPIEVAPVASLDREGEPAEPMVLWAMPEPAAPHRGLAAWALGFSIAGLVVALFVGWGFPLGIVGIVAAILALRRPLESRAVAWWALALGVLSLIYSAGWLLFAASRAGILP